jgi:hypothetical protein
MTLGDYIERHSYITKPSGPERRENHMGDVLRRRIEEVIGKAVDVSGADVIDWELAEVRTNPGVQRNEDERIRAALAEGKGYSAEGTSDNIIDSQSSGRGF